MLVEDYHQMLLSLELGLEPPRDVISAIFTLTVIPENIERANEPYAVARQSLRTRAFALLRQYVRELHRDQECDILRREMSAVLDCMTARKKINRLPQVLNLESLPQRLAQPGMMYNFVQYALAHSLDSLGAEYRQCHDVWMPLLHIILELIAMQYKHESDQGVPSTDSVLSSFIEQMQFVSLESGIVDLTFVRCLGNAKNSCSYPLYEHKPSPAIDRVFYPSAYKQRESMILRFNFLQTCCSLVMGDDTNIQHIDRDKIVNNILLALEETDDTDSCQFFISQFDFTLHELSSCKLDEVDQIDVKLVDYLLMKDKEGYYMHKDTLFNIIKQTLFYKEIKDDQN